MTRPLYTDPLAAAWMAKHFGMKFADGDSFKSACEVVHLPDVNYSPFIIHPDSLHLLKPYSGDLLLWRGYGVPEWKFEVAGKHTTMSGWEFRIIQRNGIAFMWPESEAA